MITLRSATAISRKFPHLSEVEIAGIASFAEHFRFGISEETLAYLERDEFGVPLRSDPLARLYWPFPDLLRAGTSLDYGTSDNWEFAHEFPIPGNSAWQWKYSDRICFRAHRCDQYCFHCFESNRTMKQSSPLKPRAEDWPEGVAFIRDHPEIREVIFTGGEPLIMSDRRLRERLSDLRQPGLEHVRSIRIHTAKGKHDTDRLSEGFARLCREFSVTEIALHIVHPRQVTPRFVAAMHRLASLCGSTLRLAHIPLLGGVNDDTDVLKELCMKLGEVGVKPYYALLEMPSTSGIKTDRLSVHRAVEVIRPLVGREFSHMLCPEPIIVARGGKKTIPMERGYFGLSPLEVLGKTVWAIDDTHVPLKDFGTETNEGRLAYFEFLGTPDFIYSIYRGRPVVVFKSWRGNWEMYSDVAE